MLRGVLCPKEGSAVVDIGTDMGVREGKIGRIGRRKGRARGEYCNIHTGTGPRRANADAIGAVAAKRTMVHQRMYGQLTEPKSAED